MELADIVQQRPGDEEVAIAPGKSRRAGRPFHDLEDVLEQAAAIRVMHLARGRPDAEPLGIGVDHPREQRSQRRPLDAGDAALQLLPHLVHGPRGGWDAVLAAETAVGILGNDAANLVENELEPLIEEVAPRLHRDELAGVELRVVEIDVLKDLGPHFPGDVLEEQRQEDTAVAPGAPLFARAQEEAGAGGRARRAQRSWAGA